MDEKIIYSIKDIAVNPDFVGVIVAPHSDSYIFEDPSEVPEEVADNRSLPQRHAA